MFTIKHKSTMRSCAWNHTATTCKSSANLGTVPFYVDEAMENHRFSACTWNLRCECCSEPALDKVPANTVASLSTHDTATFMGFWTVPTSSEWSLACSRKRKRNRSIDIAQRSEKR